MNSLWLIPVIILASYIGYVIKNRWQGQWRFDSHYDGIADCISGTSQSLSDEQSQNHETDKFRYTLYVNRNKAGVNGIVIVPPSHVSANDLPNHGPYPVQWRFHPGGSPMTAKWNYQHTSNTLQLPNEETIGFLTALPKYRMLYVRINTGTKELNIRFKVKHAKNALDRLYETIPDTLMDTKWPRK